MIVRTKHLRPRAALLVAALHLLALDLAACPDDGEATGGKPTAGADGRERWVLSFEGEAPDLSEYRTLLQENPKAAGPYETQMRDQLMRGRTELDAFLGSVEGRVVERWWMSNAVTVEVPASAVESLKKQPGVKSVTPDPTLE